MTYKRKLFFSFLIIAFLPTAGLIILSYHLATEGADLLVARGVSETLAAADSLVLWVLQEEETNLGADIQNLAIDDIDVIQKALETDRLFDFVIAVMPDSTTLQFGTPPGVLESLASDLSRQSGRQIDDGKLLIWHQATGDSIKVIVGRYLSEEYFQLANQVLEGRTKYSSLSRTLLPGGKNLLLKVSLALIVVFLILSLLASQMLSFGMSSPLEKMTEATKRIAGGDLKYRIPEKRKDEIGELIDDFNLMTDKLQRTTESLLIAEREMTWQETARTIAHEIKNLLTPINITLYKMKQNIGEHDASHLSKSVDALSREVDAIAELAQQFALFAHPPKLAQTDVSVKQLLEEVTSLYAECEGNYSIDIIVDPQNLHLRADRDLLRRAVSNLVKNSLEATHFDGHITIAISEQEDCYRLTVSDDGPGADLGADLTQPYLTTKKSGTGLGLAIVKKICQSHNWKLSYENLIPGFCVKIEMPKNDDQTSIHS